MLLASSPCAGFELLKRIRAELIEKARAVNDHRRAQVESQARIIKQEVDGLGDDRAAIAAALDE